MDEGEKTRVWILGASGDGRCGEIYGNVRQLCEDLQLTVVGEGSLDVGRAEERDFVIFCDDSIRPYADPAELGEFIAGGGRVILAAGLGEDGGDSGLWPAFGIQEKSPGEDCRDLVFEKPLLPVQPERARYDGDSGSARIKVSAGTSVYIRDGETGIPILYTYAWQECMELLEELGTEDVEFLGQANIKEHLPEVDLLLLSSISEEQPLAILEGEREDDSFGPTGLVVPIMNSEAMARASLRCIRNPDLMMSMGRAGRKQVEAYYSREEMLDAFRSIYKRLEEESHGRNRI